VTKLTVRTQASANCLVPLLSFRTRWSSTIPISSASGSGDPTDRERSERSGGSTRQQLVRLVDLAQVQPHANTAADGTATAGTPPAAPAGPGSPGQLSIDSPVNNCHC